MPWKEASPDGPAEAVHGRLPSRRAVDHRAVCAVRDHPEDRVQMDRSLPGLLPMSPIAQSGRSRRQSRPSLRFQSISPGNYLEFAADGFLDRNDRSRLEHESRKHRAKLVNGHRIVALYQHMPTPLADPYHEEFDLEIGGRLPLTEYLKDSHLGILVLDGRTLRAFEPADHVFHCILLI